MTNPAPPKSQKQSVDTSVEESQSNISQRRAEGEFVRGVSGFRQAVGTPDFPAEPNRYHLYVALNCPWCHRVLLARNILGLQDAISVDVVFPNRTGEDDPVASNLWEFNPARLSTLTGKPFDECTLETATGKGYRLVKEIYQREGADEGSVPVLFDKQQQVIVNNESAEIVRMLNRVAAELGSNYSNEKRIDLYPSDTSLQADIDELNDLIYVNINNGAYKAGFSSDQSVYLNAYNAYFETLSELNNRLSDGRVFLTGNQFTEVDLRLYPTLYRHDPVYYIRMKLNGAKIVDYPHVWKWLCRVYSLPGVEQSNSLAHCKQGYFGRSWNNVIPVGPVKPMKYPEAYLHPELSDRG